jgi:hypothetical protein
MNVKKKDFISYAEDDNESTFIFCSCSISKMVSLLLEGPQV